MAEIRAFQEDGPTADEIQKVTEAERRSSETNRQRNGWWLAQLSFADRYGADPAVLLDDSLLDGVSQESVQSAARLYLRMDNFVRVTLLPEAGEGVSD